MTDKEIIKKAKQRIRKQGKVPLLYLINDELRLNTDINHADNIAAKMESTSKYERYFGHNPNDIFIRRSANYKTRLIAILSLIVSSLVFLFKALEALKVWPYN